MTALPSLRQLRYLLALAEHLNFTRAAEACFVSQSTLSAGLKELETTLGVQLVERDKQTVTLTQSGVEVAARARRVLASAEDLCEFAADSTRPMHRQLRLGIIPTVAPFVLPAVMPILREKFPQLKLNLREDLTANLLSRLRNRALDFALIALPYETEDLRVLSLFKDRFWLVGQESDRSITGRTIRISNQWSERLLLLEEGHCLREHAIQACSIAEVPNTKGIEATSLLTLVQMVASGMGVALVPDLAVKGGLLSGMSLKARPLAAPAPERTIALVTRSTSPYMNEFEAIARVISSTHQKSSNQTTTE